MKSNKPLARKLKKAAKELEYPIKGPLAIKGEDKKFLFQYLKESEFGIGHNAPDSLHNTEIEGYDTELTDEVSKKTGKPITRKQLTDQRIYTRDNDLMNSATIIYESHMSGEEESDDDGDGLTGAEQFEAAIYQAQMLQTDDNEYEFLDRYGLKGRVFNENAPVIQTAFLELISGDIHKLGLHNAKKWLKKLHTEQVAKTPSKVEKLDLELNNALQGLSNWYNLETQYLTAKGILELDPSEREVVNNLPAKERAAKEAEFMKLKRQARAQKIKNRV